MLESREDLPFAKESREDLIGIHAALDELDGHPLAELTVRPLGEPDGSHTAASNLLDHSIRPNRGTDEFPGFGAVSRRKLGGAGFEESTGAVVGRQQRLDFPSQFRVSPAELVERCCSSVPRETERPVED
jgi:hypothetical protein